MLVLASGSIGRRTLLEQAGVPHDVMSASIDEAAAKAPLRARGLGPSAIADALAELKALEVSERRPQDLVLGCDQTLALENGLEFDKPPDLSTLAEQLRMLSGKTHSLYSAMVIAQQGQIVWRNRESVRMTMRTLSDQFIADYLESEGDVLLGCVGGYRIEGLGIQLFSQIEGGHFAIMGLPLLPLLAYLRSEEILPA
ncbi:Maf family protein [Aquisediminimonas profunda]|uniref:Maf family protein n=1 Tax=Aquisediminimonas profunda TaxID=1550733 RepID=UPI001C63B73D|nr:Maf family protein [Aquisediminimonas profunda]